MTNAAMRFDIVEGCDLGIARAIAAFENEWGPYSAASRRFSIFRLVERYIDPAWHAYACTLQNRTLYQELFGDVVPSRLARSSGFSSLDLIWAKVLDWSSLIASPPSAEAANISTVLSLRATLDTLRYFAKTCAAKRPKRQALGPLNIMRPWRALCEFCGNRTEVMAYKEGGHWPEDGEETARLSSRYCSNHRPRLLDESWNVNYRRALLTRKQFNEEVRRLSSQSVALSSPKAQTGDSLLDLFYLYLGRKRCFYPDEESSLRDEARVLVDSKMTDRKKRFVVLLVQGYSQAEIARQACLERQVVWRQIQAIPHAYRLDLDR